MTTHTTRLEQAFQQRQARSTGRCALIPYITAGYPEPAVTVPLMHALVQAGADVIELGVPFSDPMADGPVIQQTNEIAISQGTTLRRVLEMVTVFRQGNDRTPVVLMGYANPIERIGPEAFAREAAEAGVDGVLVVDYPPEEVERFSALLDDVGVAPIFLLAPTSTEARMASIGKVAKGYVYYVSLKGVTGSGSLNVEEVNQRLALIRQHVALPVGVGFGIRDQQSACALGEQADAVVIGSRLLQTITEAAQGVESSALPQACARAAAEWLASIRAALDTLTVNSSEKKQGNSHELVG
ncbi:MAG: tryptophan synthase subunit alpha [Pigmentiphaga sp.]|nr:tryptophan synthase subunit alpha [Pigmentiphaga sp.]